MNIRLLIVVTVSTLIGFCRCAYCGSGETTINYSLLVYNPARSLAGSRVLNGGGAQSSSTWGSMSPCKASFMAMPPLVRVSRFAQCKFARGHVPVRGDACELLIRPSIQHSIDQDADFGEMLFDGANTGAYGNLFRQAGVTGLSAHNNGFAMACGGGMDFAISKHVGIRAAQLDYFLTRYEWKPIGINNQSIFRYQAGVVFAWGDE